MFDVSISTAASVKPKSGGTPKQLIMFLHGLGADGHDLIGLAPEMADDLPHAQFISPDAPFPCDMAPYGRQWFSLQSRNNAHMMTGINAATPLLNAYIDACLKEYQLEIGSLFVVGFSQGTMIALHTMLTRKEPCAGIVGFSGAIVGSREFIPTITAKPPVCLIHGEQDTVVPFAALPDAEAALLKAGISVEAHPQQGLGHSINPQGLQAAINFIKARV
jgi:phospholipase/carboxylesterase